MGFLHTTALRPLDPAAGPTCRLGLATRGGTHLTEDNVYLALEKGINFLNWPGCADALGRVIGQLGERRRQLTVCVQFEARTADDAKRELEQILRDLNTDYVDILTFYYVEEGNEWRDIVAPCGALDYCRQAKESGVVRYLGLTSHQRRLAAEVARSGLLDLLMIRYNAAHRGAETEVFPVTDALCLPVIVYTCLRWGALLEPTPDDSVGFVVPRAPVWYRFALHAPSVTVALMAPDDRRELEEDLTVLQATGPLTAEEYARLAAHGLRVRKHAGSFP